MCGICGIYKYETGQPVDEQVLGKMLDVIQHRGPDDYGTHIDNGLGIGMRRLSIIDLAGGHQPIFNEDGTMAVICNGEIYNYRELADELRGRGHRFTTASDTEVIVHLYEEYGDDCVHQLRGMFSFAVWDGRKRRLLVVRDRLGIKPLYYTESNGQFVFASEIKSILQVPGISAVCDRTALGYYLSLKYVPAPQTMFQDIASLPPGHLLTCDRKGVQVRSYWDLHFEVPDRAQLAEEEYAEQLEDLLRESVRLRLRSDVPFGAFLSGGVDSSTIVALMSQMLNRPVKTFSVGFDAADGKDELPFARLVSERFGTEHHEIAVRASDFADLAQKVTWHLDQPLADQATFATYMLSELASRQVKMVLTGEGGDELFAGYARYLGERWSPAFQLMPQTVRSLAWQFGHRLPGLRRAKIGLYALCQSDEASRFASWFPLFNRDMKHALVHHRDGGHQTVSATAEIFGMHLGRTNATRSLNRMLYLDTKLWLPDLLLMRGDKMTMAHSLEARVPLLDHKIVEFAASLPTQLKLNGMIRKYLLKRVARTLLPAQIIDRKKQGFPIPLSTWMRNEARGFVRDLLSEQALKRRELFDTTYVQQLISEHESGFADHGMLLWGLISVELWFQRFIDHQQSNSSGIARPTCNTATL